MSRRAGLTVGTEGTVETSSSSAIRLAGTWARLGAASTFGLSGGGMGKGPTGMGLGERIGLSLLLPALRPKLSMGA